LLIGEFAHALDEKGRLTMPAKFRDELGPRFVVTMGLDGCLACYAPAEWERLTERLKQLPMTSRDARAFVRLLLAGATEVEPDRQGRIILATRLREQAGITANVVVVGLNTRVEIWAEDRWQAYRAEAQEAFEATADKLVDLGL
jgi:MraZ protein